MPYIEQLRRSVINSNASEVQTPGELNYAITCVIHRYLASKGMNYGTMNDIVGALESAKAEFQRRVVAPYEDTKMKLNGDVL